MRSAIEERICEIGTFSAPGRFALRRKRRAGLLRLRRNRALAARRAGVA